MALMQIRTLIGFRFLHMLSLAALSLKDKVSVGGFQVQGLLMVCNCLTISSTSKLHQPGQMSNDMRTEQGVRIWSGRMQLATCLLD